MPTVIAIPVNPALHNAAEEFLQAISHDRPAAEHYIHYIDRLTERMLAMFMIEPAEFTGLSGNARKIVDFAVSTAEKASSMLSRKTWGKISNADFAPIAADLKAALVEGDGDKVPSLLIASVDEDFAREFQEVAQACLVGEGDRVRTRMSASMDHLSDHILESFFVRQTRQIKLGMVTRKALDVGVGGSRKAIHAVNHRVLKTMDAKHLKLFMKHYGDIVRDL